MKLISWSLVFLMEAFLTALVTAAQFSCSGGDVTCLIASINSANQRAGKHTIHLASGVYTTTAIDNTVNGNTALPIITGNIRIRSASDTEPAAIEAKTGLAISAPRLFFIESFGNLTLDGIVLQDSLAGIDFVHNLGTTSILNSIIRGILIVNFSGTSAVQNFGQLTIVNSILDFNRGEHQGGGVITNELGGVASIENSTIADNISFIGGIVNRGTLSIKKSAILRNRSDLALPGGGLRNSSGTAEVVSSTFTGNRAAGGGAVYNERGTVSLLNSTVSENDSRGAVGNGGALFNSDGLLRLQNSIVSNNIDNEFSVRPDCVGDISSLGSNIIGDVNGCNINLQPSDRVGDPGLGALIGDDDENATPGQIYYPLLTGSPAIDGGNKKACPKTDQLKNTRVGVCDIGAIEFQKQALIN